jgi:hypothetical protein
MPLAILTFFTGILISAVAIYYSVIGLAAIFAAAVIPIYVMGTILELSKLVTAWWLKANWHRAPILLKTYMLIAVIALMLITSMGIFGFLSKAHSDQGLVSGDVQSKIAIYDEQIQTARDNIDANRKALKQMDEAVDQVMGRSTDEKGADKAVSIRRAQARERNRLQAEIAAEQKTISRLSAERAPIAAEVRKVEAEVGPLKYIAKLIYGDSTDTNLLEKAVTWVIILIVLVFDPLAVLLLLASQMSFQWARQEKQDKLLKESLDNFESSNESKTNHSNIKEETHVVSGPANTIVEESKSIIDPHPVGWMYPVSSSGNPILTSLNSNESNKQTDVIEEQTLNIPDVERPGDYLTPSEDTVTDNSILDEVTDDVRVAMSQWKAANPNDSLKHQRSLLERGIIKKLPWDNYLSPVVDEQHEAAVEAAKWAQEQLDKNDPSKKKDNGVDGEGREPTNQENQGRVSDGYIQNAEQSKSTLWQRVKGIKK